MSHLTPSTLEYHLKSLPKPRSQDIAIRYDKTEVLYATECLANPGVEELIVEFSSGVIADSQRDNGKTLPVHTRLALPWSAVERLARMLNQVVEGHQQRLERGPSPTSNRPPVPTVPEASLPRFDGESVS